MEKTIKIDYRYSMKKNQVYLENFIKLNISII